MAACTPSVWPGGGGGGGTPHPGARATRAQAGERVGNPKQAVCIPSVQPEGEGGGGRTAACAPRAWYIGERGGQGTQTKRVMVGYPPSSVHSQRTLCRRLGGGADQEGEGGAPLEQRALPAHGMQERGGRGGANHGGGGKTPPISVCSLRTA